MKQIRKNSRRFNHLMYKHACFCHPGSHNGLQTEDKVRELIKERTEVHYKFHWFSEKLNEILEIHVLGKKLGYTEEGIKKIWVSKSIEKGRNQRIQNLTPPPEGRDNKDVHAFGSGNRNRNSIRYPKKNRKNAWKKFYKLFPSLKP